MNNPYWRGILAFIQVAEKGSFTAAAEASGLSKANLSQQVTELENKLGVQLLYRTTRTLRLSEVGEQYFHRCKQAVQELNNASECVAQTTGELKGKINMNTVGGMIGEELVAPLLIEFQHLYPEISIDLDFSSQREDLLSSNHDLVIRMGELNDSNLIARPLQTITTRYVASPDFIAKHGDINQPEDLKDLPLIYGSVSHWQLTSGKQQRTINVNRGMHVSNGRVMRQAALAGLGVTRIADVSVQADIKKGTLVEVLPSWSQTTALSLVCPPTRYQLHRIKTLMEWLIEHFEIRYKHALECGTN